MSALASDDRAATRAFLGLGAFYAAVFAALGVLMQFLPVWLQDARGLDEAAVTFVLSAQIFARTIAGPLWAQRVDRTGRARATLLLLVALSLLATLAYAVAHGELALFCCGLFFGACYPPLHAILDNTALDNAQRHGFAYTRVRVFGSVAFLLAIVAVGTLLRHVDNAVILWLLAATLALSLAVGLLLPAAERPPLASTGAPIGRLLRDVRFVAFLLAVGLVQGSHATYYSLSTLHWRQHGIDEQTAALLWSEGIVAEIVLFYWIRDRVERLRPTTLMLLGAGGAVVRWTLLAGTTSLPWLAAINWLHAVSFGCTFLGALRFIRLRIDAELQATAQGLLGAASAGVCMALATLLSGVLYERWQGLAFVGMAGLGAIGGVLALALRRRRGGN